MPKQLKQSEIVEVRNELIMNQLGKCVLCGAILSDENQTPHTDHDHNTGRIRGILCPSCNTTEGIIIHKFTRSGLKGKGIDYIQWLKNLVNYLEADYDDNDFHPQHPKDQTKIFSRMRLVEQKEHLQRIGIDYPEKATKSVLEKLYRKSFLNNPRCDFSSNKYGYDN
jgi:hypothetical protein